MQVAAQPLKSLQLSSDGRPEGTVARKDAGFLPTLQYTECKRFQWKTTKKRRQEYVSRADKEEGKTLFQEKTNLLSCSHKVKIPRTFDEEIHFNTLSA